MTPLLQSGCFSASGVMPLSLAVKGILLVALVGLFGLPVPSKATSKEAVVSQAAVLKSEAEQRFDAIVAAWSSYEAADTPPEKTRNLQRVQALSEHFLAHHSADRHAGRVIKYLEKANKLLPQ